MKSTIITTIALTFLFTSCAEKKKTAENNKESSPLEKLLLASTPEKAIDIADLRKSAQAGDTVTFTGNVIGSEPVFMDGRAVMIMGDPKKITSCNLIPGDECETPWDVCCDDPDVIKASIVTVQVVDDAGKPLKTGLKGLGGMKELSALTVTGEVAEGSNKDNMLVNATGIFVQR
ncbi:MAG: hypothetical protein P8P32_01030 [Akkermansiaceae bacterium]|nr:hypothetical protein [Akkermansiaceae bacterium]